MISTRSELTSLAHASAKWLPQLATRRSGVRVVVVAMVLLQVANTTIAQESGATVSDVRFEGATASEDYLLGIVRTRVGDSFDREAVDQDAVRLLQTGKFLTAVADVTLADAGVIVTFKVQHRPVVESVAFQGNDAISASDLTTRVPTKVGDPIDTFALREGRDNILFQYRSKGYGYASVVVDEATATQTGRIVYRIEEGPKVRVQRILFEGSTVFDVKTLTKQIHTNTALWVFRTGSFDPDQVSDDAAAIQNFYRREGYLDARASYRVDPGEKPGDIVVVFTIAEGDQYNIESISIQGNNVLTADEIVSLMLSKEGRIFKQDRIDKDVRTIRDTYGQRGYIYAGARATRVFSSTPGFVAVSISISEGDKIQVGRIDIRGNALTRDKVIRRALNLFPGDTFNLAETKAAEKRLTQTRLFDRATVSPTGDQAGVRDIIIDIAENEGTTNVGFTFGVTSDSGLIGSILLEFNNFDIFDPPRSFSEFVKLRAFRGGGQRLRLELQPGTELSRFRADFTEPYLFDQPLRFDLGAYLFQRNREAFDEQRIGTNVAFGKRLKNGITAREYFKDWYGEVSFRVEQISLDGINVFADRSVRDADGESLLVSTRLSLVRDHTDSRYQPTSGDRLSMSYEQFVGDFNFGKLRARYARHQTIYTDAQNRKSVLSLRTSVGAIAGVAPVFEKFYAGGIGSIRGFDFRGVGPRGGLESDPIGGDFLLTASAEYSFPIAGDKLRGAFFTDMGTVEDDFGVTAWRASVGLGIRMVVDIFGPVPIELDFASPISKDGDDDTRIFSFFIGGSL